MLENWNSPVPIKRRLVYFVGCVHFYIEHISLSWERSPCCVYHYGLNLPSTRCPHLVCGRTTHPHTVLSPSSIQLTEEDVVQHVQSTFITSSPITLADHSPRYLIYSMIFLPPCCWWCLLSVADYECLKWLAALMSLIWCNGQSFSRLRRYISTKGLFVGDLGCDSACMPERMCVCMFVLHKCQRESACCNRVFHFVIAECQTFTS